MASVRTSGITIPITLRTMPVSTIPSTGVTDTTTIIMAMAIIHGDGTTDMPGTTVPTDGISAGDTLPTTTPDIISAHIGITPMVIMPTAVAEEDPIPTTMTIT